MVIVWCVCACACMCACVRVCVYVCESARVCECAHVCVEVARLVITIKINYQYPSLVKQTLLGDRNTQCM